MNIVMPFGICEDDSKLRRRQRDNVSAEFALTRGPALLSLGDIVGAALDDLRGLRARNDAWGIFPTPVLRLFVLLGIFFCPWGIFPNVLIDRSMINAQYLADAPIACTRLQFFDAFGDALALLNASAKTVKLN
jgi:hypothetical protein